MIWLPRTTDISTHFAQSLEIRGIESGLLYISKVSRPIWIKFHVKHHQAGGKAALGFWADWNELLVYMLINSCGLNLPDPGIKSYRLIM